ncbi:hypothetical protein CYLTODRAFT_415537, partial [Cylindrobasidium torrendii FP15055 ss-10]
MERKTGQSLWPTCIGGASLRRMASHKAAVLLQTVCMGLQRLPWAGGTVVEERKKETGNGNIQINQTPYAGPKAVRRDNGGLFEERGRLISPQARDTLEEYLSDDETFSQEIRKRMGMVFGRDDAEGEDKEDEDGEDSDIPIAKLVADEFGIDIGDDGAGQAKYTAQRKVHDGEEGPAPLEEDIWAYDED